MKGLRGALMTGFLITALACVAQEEGRLPDSTDTILFRAVPDSVASRYRKDDHFAYANDPAYWQRPKAAPQNTAWVRVAAWLLTHLFYLLLAGALALVIIALVRDNGARFFFRSSKKTPVTMAEDAGNDPLQGDLDAQIQEALAAKNHRLVIRLLFLKTLQILDKKGIIRYQARTTNQEYGLQMESHASADRFRFLSGAYEHVWYGEFLLGEAQFDRLWRIFQDFFKTINKD